MNKIRMNPFARPDEKFLAIWGFAFLCAALSPGCGYHLVGRGGPLARGGQRIGVPIFENRTDRPEIEQRITEQVISELNTRTKLIVSGDDHGVDTILEGVILFFGVQPVAINPDGRATRYEIIVRASVTLQDLHNDLLLWEDQHFVFRGQYDVDPNIQTFVDEEIIAIEEIARGFAESVVTSLLEGF